VLSCSNADGRHMLFALNSLCNLVCMSCLNVASCCGSWAVIKNFILKDGDKTQAPDFAMTPAELDLKEELAVGFDKKVQHAKGLVRKVMDLKPLMLAGNVDEVFRGILMDKELMEVSRPASLSPQPLMSLLFSLHDFPRQQRSALTPSKKRRNPDIEHASSQWYAQHVAAISSFLFSTTY